MFKLAKTAAWKSNEEKQSTQQEPKKKTSRNQQGISRFPEFFELSGK